MSLSQKSVMFHHSESSKRILDHLITIVQSILLHFEMPRWGGSVGLVIRDYEFESRKTLNRIVELFWILSVTNIREDCQANLLR